MPTNALNSEVTGRLKEFLLDFRKVKNKSFNYFYCPILQADDDVEIIKGHIIPESLGNCNFWVPQRKDLDSFFGYFLEADLPAIINERNIDPILKIIDRKLFLKHKPSMQFEGENLKFFISDIKNPSAKASIEVASIDGAIVKQIMVTNPPKNLLNSEKATINIVIEKNYLPHATGSLLKAAHLSLFKMIGYDYIFSPSGFHLSSILKEFYYKFLGKPKKESQDELEKFFTSFAGMILPIYPGENVTVKGTILDGKAIACIGASGICFSIGVIIPFGKQLFSVFVPNHSTESVYTYQNFISDPPPSFKGIIVEFVNNPETGHAWVSETGNEIRFMMAPEEFQDKYYNSI